MKTRHFPAAIIATATLTWSSYAAVSVGAQDSTTFSPVPPPSNPPPLVQPVQLSPGVEDVMKLSRAKVSEDVIIAFVQNGNRQFSLSATEILYLRNQGVSDRVLTAMLGQTPPPATPPPATDSAFAAQASAPQYISQPATAYLEPVSTVYVGTPTYYSFYDPWPYWSSWYAYPAFSFGFYWGWGWGGCGYWSYPSYCYPKYNYCYSGSWNKYHNGYYSSAVNTRPVAGNQPLVSEMRQPSGVSRARPLVSEMRQPTGVDQRTPLTSEMRQPSGVNSGNGLVSEGRQPTGVGNSANTRPAGNRTENRGQPTSVWTAKAQPNTRPVSQSATAPSVNPRPVATGSSDALNRTAITRPLPNTARQGTAPRSTGVWTGSSQRSAAPTYMNQNLGSVSRPSTSSGTWSRPASPSVSRGVTPSLQRSASPGYRSSGNVGGVSRPTMSPSFSSRSGSSAAGAFRGSSGFSGGGGRPVASGGGGLRGGGMGGGGTGRGR